MVVILLSLPRSGVWSQPYIKKPIPVGPSARTAKSWDSTYREFYRREIAEAYRKCGFHNPNWDAEAIKFLDDSLKLEHSSRHSDEIQALCTEGKTLVDAGCNDPMVLLEYGTILSDSGRKSDAASFLESSVEGFKKSSYHKCRARLAPLQLAEIRFTYEHAKEGDNRPLCDLAFEWTIESLRDGSYHAGEQRIALENFCDTSTNDLTTFHNQWSDVLAQLEKKRPTDPYVDRVTRARCHDEMGWAARGGGYAYTVTHEGWKVFRRELGIADTLLKEAWKLHPELPEAPCEMIGIARSQCAPGETPRMWFDRTVAAQMDFMNAYRELMFSMSKMWQNDMEGLYEFGIECAKTERYDTLVPMQLTTALSNLTSRSWRQVILEQPEDHQIHG